MSVPTGRFSAPATSRLEFGPGSLAALPGIVRDLPCRRVVVVTDAGIRECGILDRVRETLTAAGIAHSTFDQVEANPSVATLDRARSHVRDVGDCAIVALGGGSSIDVAKGVAFAEIEPEHQAPTNDPRRSSADTSAVERPIVAIPTTAGTGAETNGFGVIEDTTTGHKVYVGDSSVTPRASVLDPELTVSMPRPVTAATGMDALVHAVESLLSLGRNTVSEAYAHHAARVVFSALPVAVTTPHDLDARSAMLLGAHLAGRALTLSGLGLVHGIAHCVTLRTGAPHGLALSAVFADVLAFSLPTSVNELARLAFDIGAGRTDRDSAANARSAIAAIRDLIERVGCARSLRELGCSETMLADLPGAVLADPVTRNAPRRPAESDLRGLLEAAW